MRWVAAITPQASSSAPATAAPAACTPIFVLVLGSLLLSACDGNVVTVYPISKDEQGRLEAGLRRTYTVHAEREEVIETDGFGVNSLSVCLLATAAECSKRCVVADARNWECRRDTPYGTAVRVKITSMKNGHLTITEFAPDGSILRSSPTLTYSWWWYLVKFYGYVRR